MHTPGYESEEQLDLTWQASSRFAEDLDAEIDFVAEELLENLTSTPLGRLLKIIGHLPDIRRDKVTEVRGRIHREEYDVNEHLDAALDRVLEEFIAEG